MAPMMIFTVCFALLHIAVCLYFTYRDGGPLAPEDCDCTGCGWDPAG